jgi:hypothetical protein
MGSAIHVCNAEESTSGRVLGVIKEYSCGQKGCTTRLDPLSVHTDEEAALAACPLWLYHIVIDCRSRQNVHASCTTAQKSNLTQGVSQESM